MEPALPRRPITRITLILAGTAALVGAILVAPGCNTTEGVGKDVKSLGKGVEESAKDAKN